MRKKRILLLSEGFGSGHTQAAHALAAGLRLTDPQIVARVIELGSFQHPSFAPLVFTAYRKTISSRPKLYSLLYRSKREKSLGRVTKLALHRLFYARTAAIIRQLRPDLIVCTHPFPCLVVSRLKQSEFDIPLCGVITDYDAHAAWVDPQVNKYLVSTDAVKDGLIQLGVPPERIEVTGIPVHPKFWEAQDKDLVRNQLGLAKLPTVLVMGGGWGLFEDEGVIDHTIAWRDRVQLIYCLGNNEKAMKHYMEDKRFNHPNVRLLGYTKEVDKLMEVSDLLITKPGGMTCTEAIAKRIPMLFYRPIPGQEEENCQYFIDNGFGERIESLETVNRWFRLLTEHYPDLVSARQAARQHPGPAGQRQCSRAIISLLQHRLSDK